MIGMRCRSAHRTPAGLCDDCARLLAYAEARIDACRFGADKPVCNRCPVHCYSRPMRDQVRTVMRFSGPRMPLAHPLLAVLHLRDSLR